MATCSLVVMPCARYWWQPDLHDALSKLLQPLEAIPGWIAVFEGRDGRGGIIGNEVGIVFQHGNVSRYLPVHVDLPLRDHQCIPGLTLRYATSG